MRAIQIKQYLNGPEDMVVTEVPDPIPKPDEYLIQIHATATNFFDLLQIRGKYQNQPPLPWISGFEFSGTVLSTPTSPPSPQNPSNPPYFPIGTPIFGASQGAYATKITAPHSSLRPLPANWSFADAAGLMVTAPTSYAALVTRAHVQRGDVVLIHAAAGGVGLAAVQIAKAFGAIVIATAGGERKLEVAKGYGADFGVDYSVKGWEERVRGLTKGGRGVDIVVDAVGMVNASLKCMAWNGRVVIVGFAGGEVEKVAMNRVLLKNVSLVGVHWGLYSKQEPGTVDEVWEGLFRLMEEGKFRGTVFSARKFVGLERVGEALGMLGRRETWGKVVVSVPQEEGSRL